MASRNNEIRPVGAWVEPEPYYGAQYQEAVVSAQYEEAKILRTQAEKECKLRQFQDGVKKRVQMMERIKRQQLLEKSYKAVEVERNVLNQSAQAAERTTPRKNRCMIRDDSNLGIRHSSQLNSQGCIISDRPLESEDNKNFLSQSNQVRQFSSQARRNLTSYKVLSEPFNPDGLPGGIWRSGPARDGISSRSADLDSEEDVGYVGHAEERENIPIVPLENIPIVQPKTVHFNLDNIEESEAPRQKGLSQHDVDRVLGRNIQSEIFVPNIYPGVENEEEKQLAIKQRAMYRRLFMDIEREQVKENERRKEHRKKITKLKKEKEEARRHLEAESHLVTAPKDPVTGETFLEIMVREREEEDSIRKAEEEYKEKVKKGKETERYLEALKHQLREKVAKQNMELPALCCCGMTVWDTNPETCANNCVFYKNPKAYGRALQSLLASCQVV